MNERSKNRHRNQLYSKLQRETIILEEVLIIKLADRQEGEEKKAASGGTWAVSPLMSQMSLLLQNLLIVS